MPLALLLLLLFAAASRIALRLAHGARFADVAFPDHFIVLVLLMIWTHLSPPGSAARWWGRFAIWVTTSSITLGFVWGWVGPPRRTPKGVVWGIAVFNVLASLYLLIFH